MTRWFGEPWPSEAFRAPVCADDADRVPVPVSGVCLFCEELVDEDDQGTMMPFTTAEDFVNRRGITGFHPLHVECLIRQTLGPVAYLEGRCTHAGGTEDCIIESQSKRQDAQATYRWVQERGR